MLGRAMMKATVRRRLVAASLLIALAGCPNGDMPGLDLSGEQLAQACQFYYGVKAVVDMINHPALNSAAAIIEAYLGPVCRAGVVIDANTAAWVRRNATELETASGRAPYR